mgnify:CR=1 FL=1
MEILRYATKDDLLRQLITDYVTKNFREDLRKALGIMAVSIDLKWNNDFEQRLTLKKSKPLSERTLKDYRSLFKSCLEVESSMKN